ncbi:beta-ketoacyl synthase N-terminal-like domain-containing protein [Actinophytocola sp.]|jgi:3-oxoacyl-[acyl-carrier-protein] synthase II|uniref:beta-ketoacyl synthase N-terminal-like domain-containing protein n=1 Tax=Actinophytocola sp. TaxID=1872138 RepID=UPI002ED84037
MPTVITAWSATSPFGYGRAAFADAVRAGRTAPTVEHSDDWFPKPDTAHVVPAFDLTEQLGRKGTSSMDRTTALAVSTLRRLQRDEPGSVAPDARTGVVLGTTSGSTQTQFAFTGDSLTRRKPYFVNPAMMPFALMNSAAAQCASWHGLTGPNTTIAAGRLSGIAVLRYAGRLLRTGRASGVFAGAAEEYGGARTLLERGSGGTSPLGEGCAMLFLQPSTGGNRSAVAEVVAVDTRLAVAGEPRIALVECLRRVLAGVAPHEVWGVALSGQDPATTAMERDAVGEALGREVGRVVVPGELIGDTGAATGPFQLAALLALAEGEDVRGRVAVATAVDRDGMVGCVVVRLLGGSGIAKQVRGSR